MARLSDRRRRELQPLIDELRSGKAVSIVRGIVRAVGGGLRGERRFRARTGLPVFLSQELFEETKRRIRVGQRLSGDAPGPAVTDRSIPIVDRTGQTGAPPGKYWYKLLVTVDTGEGLGPQRKELQVGSDRLMSENELCDRVHGQLDNMIREVLKGSPPIDLTGSDDQIAGSADERITCELLDVTRGY